jgi:hypothetical protein
MAVAFGTAGTATADNDIGCGVGTMVFEGKSGVGFKILGSFTNQITFQSISITFGLLNCGKSDTITAFTGSNLDQLASDMATGEGETLAALGTLLDISSADRASFYSLTQDNFTVLFPSETTTAGEVLTNLQFLMREDARLSFYARS